MKHPPNKVQKKISFTVCKFEKFSVNSILREINFILANHSNGKITNDHHHAHQHEEDQEQPATPTNNQKLTKYVYVREHEHMHHGHSHAHSHIHSAPDSISSVGKYFLKVFDFTKKILYLACF